MELKFNRQPQPTMYNNLVTYLNECGVNVVTIKCSKF